MNEYNSMGKGGPAGDSFREGPKGPEKAKAPKYTETCNPNATVPKLPQIKGAE